MQNDATEIRTSFLSDADWLPVNAAVTQDGDSATISIAGVGDLESATPQVLRSLSLDVDGRLWPEVGGRDPVIADAQHRLPGFRPCGFFSPYEAPAWAVLSQRIRMRQAATMKADLTVQHSVDGAFPAPAVILSLDLDLPGRKTEYRHAVAVAALAGRLSSEYLRSLDSAAALEQVREVKGLGPFAAEFVVIRGANLPDVLPSNEAQLSAEFTEL